MINIDGGMYVYGNTRMYGNLYVKETATYERIINLVVSDTTITFGQGNDGTNDPTLLFTYDQDESNVALGFRIGDRGREMALYQTTGGPLDSTFPVDDSLSTNLHVFGDIYTSNNVGVANTYPVHNLCVGSNLFVEDTGSNVLEVHGNTYTQKRHKGDIKAKKRSSAKSIPLRRTPGAKTRFRPFRAQVGPHGPKIGLFRFG